MLTSLTFYWSLCVFFFFFFTGTRMHVQTGDKLEEKLFLVMLWETFLYFDGLVFFVSLQGSTTVNQHKLILLSIFVLWRNISILMEVVFSYMTIHTSNWAQGLTAWFNEYENDVQSYAMAFTVTNSKRMRHFGLMFETACLITIIKTLSDVSIGRMVFMPSVSFMSCKIYAKAQ